jgi:hypothetical protein
MRGVADVVVRALRLIFPPKAAPEHDASATHEVMRESRYWRAKAAALVAQARVEGRSSVYKLGGQGQKR